MDYSWPCFREGHDGAFCWNCARDLMQTIDVLKKEIAVLIEQRAIRDEHIKKLLDKEKGSL